VDETNRKKPILQ